MPGYLDAAGWLAELQREGKIDLLGGTNFDTPHTAELVAAGIDLAQHAGAVFAARRSARARPRRFLPRRTASSCCATAPSPAGSFPIAGSARPEPEPPFENRSLTKYKLIIDDFGGWALFQELLQALRRVADRHGTDIASVASRAMLDRPGVAAVIVGARSRAHVAANAAIPLDRARRGRQARRSTPCSRSGSGPPGDTFALERDRTGRHGAIMKYNLNKVA